MIISRWQTFAEKWVRAQGHDYFREESTTRKHRQMKKLILLLTAVAFMAGSLGFIGCGGIDEDPDAAANEAKSEEFAPDPGSPDDDPVKSTDIPGGAGKFGIPPEKKD